MSEINHNVKRVFLAGVGMVTEAVDVTKEKLEELSAKGNKYLEEQNEKAKKWFDEMVKKGGEVMGDKSAANEPLHCDKKEEDFIEKIKNMTPEQLAKLREEVDKITADQKDAK